MKHNISKFFLILISGLFLTSCAKHTTPTQKYASKSYILKNHVAIEQDSLFANAGFYEYTISDIYKKNLISYATKTDILLGTTVPNNTEYTVETGYMRVLSPILFNNENKKIPSSGSWISHFKATQNNITKQYNVIFKATGEENLKLYPLAMGETLADPLLIKDTMKGILPSIAMTPCVGKLESIKDYKILNTTILTNELKDRFITEKMFENIKEWKEEWVIELNSTSLNVPIKFFKREGIKGTSFMKTFN